MRLETERLIIRDITTGDAEFQLDLMNRPKWIEFIGDRGVRSLEQARDYIEDRMLPQLDRLGFTNNVIELKPTSQPIGTCGLYDREGVTGLDIGYALLSEHEGQGYAREACAALLQYAKEKLNQQQVRAIVLPNHERSIHLLNKLGFDFEEKVNIPNDPEELNLYVLDLSKFNRQH